MYTKGKSRVKRQKLSSSKFNIEGQKLKKKMVVSKAFLSLPGRRSPEISVICLSRKTNSKHSLELSSSLKVREKTRSDTLGSARHKIPQSRQTSVYTEDAGPYLFYDEGNKEEPLKNAPTGRREKETNDVKHSVLRTISRMLQENKIIRAQWIRPSQI